MINDLNTLILAAFRPEFLALLTIRQRQAIAQYIINHRLEA